MKCQEKFAAGNASAEQMVSATLPPSVTSTNPGDTEIFLKCQSQVFCHRANFVLSTTVRLSSKMYDFQFCQILTDSFTDYAFKTFTGSWTLHSIFSWIFLHGLSHLGLNSTLKLVQLLTPSQPWSEVTGSRDWEEAEQVEVDWHAYSLNYKKCVDVID